MLTFMLPHWDLRSTETAILVIILILFLSFKPTEKLCWVKVPRTWCRKGIYFITSNKSKDGSVFQSWLIQSGTHHESFSARMALYFEGTLRHLYLTNPGKRPRQLLSNGISPIFTVEQRANTSEEWSLYNKYYQWINSRHFFFCPCSSSFISHQHTSLLPRFYEWKPEGIWGWGQHNVYLLKSLESSAGICWPV